MRFKDINPQHREYLETLYAALKDVENRHKKVNVSGLYLLALACNRMHYPEHVGGSKTPYHHTQETRLYLKKIDEELGHLTALYSLHAKDSAIEAQLEVLTQVSSVMLRLLCIAMEAAGSISMKSTNSEYGLLDLFELTLDRRVLEDTFQVKLPPKLIEDKRKED